MKRNVVRCAGLEELLGRYLADDLSGAEKTQVEEHLERCEECRKAVAIGRVAERQWPALREVSPPDDLWASVARTLAEDREAARLRLATSIAFAVRAWQASRRRLAAIIALPVLALLLTYIILLRGHRESWEAAPIWPATRTGVERPTAPFLSPDYLPELLGAARAVLAEAAAPGEPRETSLLPLQSRIVAEQLSQLVEDPKDLGEFAPLLTDVELALLELTAATDDPDAPRRMEHVRRFVQEKDLLARLAVAQTRTRALAEPANLPPEILFSYLREPE
ncbi:MAG: anti-sigma factor [candidate division KSB1 bacterium]|nr:anti-sigma factor [candidate division KSB1 bacterium]